MGYTCCPAPTAACLKRTHFCPSSVHSSWAEYPPPCTNSRNSALVTKNLEALNGATVEVALPYSTSHPYVVAVAWSLPRHTSVSLLITGRRSLVGACEACAGHTFQNGASSHSGLNAFSGSCRMSTDEVSRWMRSCSMPIRMAQKGLSQVMGNEKEMDDITSTTSFLTCARYSNTSFNFGHPSFGGIRSSQLISSTPTAKMDSKRGLKRSGRRPAMASLFT
mmetsp:Transcript_2671/g.6428  ORF Transcript_2671/g.6428 Transcript_2671/m.6428 type:complete len:221 (-) Transcript_2671:473-1135(-)